jgi:hypothetical protein
MAAEVRQLERLSLRIVLVRRTGDPTPLALARPVLERLGNRKFLRRLDGVRDARK